MAGFHRARDQIVRKSTPAERLTRARYRVPEDRWGMMELGRWNDFSFPF